MTALVGRCTRPDTCSPHRVKAARVHQRLVAERGSCYMADFGQDDCWQCDLDVDAYEPCTRCGQTTSGRVTGHDGKLFAALCGDCKTELRHEAEPDHDHNPYK